MGMLGTFLGQKEVRANGSIKSTFVWKGSLLEKGQMLLRTIGIFVVDYTKYIPIKMMAVLLTLMIMVQCGLFGAVFVEVFFIWRIAELGEGVFCFVTCCGVSCVWRSGEGKGEGVFKKAVSHLSGEDSFLCSVRFVD